MTGSNFSKCGFLHFIDGVDVHFIDGVDVTSCKIQREVDIDV